MLLLSTLLLQRQADCLPQSSNYKQPKTKQFIYPFSLQWKHTNDKNLHASACFSEWTMGVLCVSLWACVCLCLQPSAVFGCGWITKGSGSVGRRGNRQTTQQLWYSPRLCAGLRRAQSTPDQPFRGYSVWR